MILRFIVPFLLVAAGPGSVQDRYRRWLDEEVPYIIAGEERVEFLRLATDAERDAFISRFWKIRDTDPSTEENEFRAEHDRRIRHANERFGEGVPGWKTERGRIWILHGPPDDMRYEYGGGSLGIEIANPTSVITGEQNPDRQRRFRLSVSRPDSEVWIYRHVAGARNTSGYFEVIFSRADPSGVISLSQRLRPYMRGNLTYAERQQRDLAIATYVSSHGIAGPFRILYAGVYRYQDVEDFFQSMFHPEQPNRIEPTEIQLGIQDIERSTGELLVERRALALSLKEKVRSRVFFEELPVTLRAGALRSGTAGAAVPVSVGIATVDGQGHALGQSADTLDLLLELVDTSGQTVASVTDSVSLKTATGQNAGWVKFLYQTRLSARPGQYRLALYAALRGHNAAVVREVDIALPDYGGGNLAMSDLLLFDEVVPKASYRSRTKQFLGRSVPVSLQDFVLIPSCDSRFRRGQKLTAFFEVYNARVEPRQQKPALRIRCRIRSENGEVQELPERLLDSIREVEERRTTYGVSVSLLGFAVGRHSIEFEVSDAVAGGAARGASTFTVY